MCTYIDKSFYFEPGLALFWENNCVMCPFIFFRLFSPPPMDRVNSRSHEAINSHSPPNPTQFPSPHVHNGSGSDVNAPPYVRPRLGSHGSMASSSHGGSGGGKGAVASSSQYHSNKAPSPSHIPGSHSHSTVSSITSPTHSVSQYTGSHSHTTPLTSGRTPPTRRANYEHSNGRHDHGSAHSELMMTFY